MKKLEQFTARAFANGEWQDVTVFADAMPQQAVPSMCVRIGTSLVYIKREQVVTFFGLVDPTTTITNIWGTAEADAWSRDFGYSDYLRICENRNTKPVSAKVYDMLREAFMQAMVDDAVTKG